MFKNKSLSLDQLYIRFCKHDIKASNELYKSTEKRLFRYIQSQLKAGDGDVEDLMQEVWAKLWDICSLVTENVSFEQRMYTVASSRAKDFYRRQKAKKRTSHEEDLHDEQAAEAWKNEKDLGVFNKHQSLDKLQDEHEGNDWLISSNSIVESNDLRLDLIKAISKLSPEEQQAFILSHEGYDNEDIGVLTETNKETAKSRVRRAREKIMQELGIQQEYKVKK